MDDFKVIKCQSCGSSVVELNDSNVAKCSHCGSLLSQASAGNHKLLKILYIIIAMLALIGGGLLWLNNKEPAKIEKLETIKKTTIKIPAYTAPIASIPKINSKAMVITNEEVKAYQDKIENPELEITNISKGKLRNNGVFWIITVQNNNIYKVYNPGLIMSLFDEQNKRIDELRVWSKLKTLESGQETVVLVNLPKPPKVKFHTEIKGMAKATLLFEVSQEVVEVKDFVLNNSKGKWIEIVGDVYNPNDFQADYVEIIAIAKDNQGKSIGIAWTFASITNMPAKSTSGFKINAGAFIVKEASTWELWAFGRKHKD